MGVPFLARQLIDRPEDRRFGPGGEQKFNSGTSSVITALIAVVLLVGGVVWIGHSELARIDARANAFETSTGKRLAGLETAVRIMSDMQKEKAVKELVRDALAVSEKAAPSMEAPVMRMERKAKPEPARAAPKAKGKD